MPAALLAGRVEFARHDLLPIGLLGIVQFGVVVSLLNYAVQFIPAARAALIFATVPLLTLLLATARGDERLTGGKAAGVLLTVAGVGLALGEQALQAGTRTNEWIGEGAALGSALGAAICSVLYRPYLRKYPALPMSALAMCASVLFLAVLAAGEGFFQALPRFTAGGWLAVAFIGLSSALGYYLWLWALRHTTATNVTVFLALGPITASGLGALYLGETISATFLFGLLAVALGLWLAYRPAKLARGTARN